MDNLSLLMQIVVAAACLYVAGHEWFYIKHEYSEEKTPGCIRLGSALQCAGALGFVFAPYFCGALIIFGRVIFYFWSYRRR